MDVGSRIKQLREERELSVNALANKAGISQSHLRDIELGNKNPTIETLSYFCDALGVSLEYFFKENCTISPVLLSAVSTLDSKQQLILSDLIKSFNGK